MNFFDYVKDIEDFAREIGMTVDPLPKISLEKSDSSKFDPFIETGNYNFRNNTITLYISNRQVKDILRTFCHELAHHSQFLESPEKYIMTITAAKKTTSLEDPEIERLEADAYMRGNLLLRKWTESKS